MNVVIAVCDKDLQTAENLLRWMAELGSYNRHTAVIVGSSKLSHEEMKSLSDLAVDCHFNSVKAIRQQVPDESGWPKAPNAMFRVALTYIENTPSAGAWAWVEPDCSPIREGWLDDLESEYKRAGKPFLGVKFDKPWVHMTGVGVYPANAAKLNPYLKNHSDLPFDCIRPELTLRHAHITKLIQHVWDLGVKDVPPTFPDAASLSMIAPETVLYHRVKDGSLISRLRERLATQNKSVKGNGHSTKKSVLRSLFNRIPKETITIRRTGAIGDALAATCVATKLNELGYDVVFRTHKTCQPVLKFVPGIRVADANGDCDIDLDGAYEKDPERRNKHFAEMFTEVANRQLSGKRNIRLKPLNIAPTLVIPERLRRRFMRRYRYQQRPWIAICPRSNSFNVRTVPDETWSRAAKLMPGTKFWIATHGPPPEHIAKCETKDAGNMAIALSCMDLVLGVDSGPIHVAVALKVPVIAVEQSSSPDVHLSDQRDFALVRPEGLACLNCQDEKCRFNADDPPCQYISPLDIANAVNRRLNGLASDDVTAIVVIHRPPAERLNKCLSHLLPQVAEVIVCACGASRIPQGAMQHPKVRYITSRQNDIGYGRKLNFAMRHTVTPFVCDLNDDVYLDPGAVAEMVRVIKTDDKIAKVGCLLLYPDRKTIQHGGCRRNPGDLAWGHADHRMTEPSVKAVTEMEFVTGACSLIRRSAFYDAGGMDERFHLYYDDGDEVMSMRQRGWKIMYTPFASAIHDEHSSTGTVAVQLMAAEVQRSRAVFKEKWQWYFDKNSRLSGIAPELGTFQ